MFSNTIELVTKPGQVKAMLKALHEIALPTIILSSPGFIREIVLHSVSDPNHVLAISIWATQADAEAFLATKFDQTTAVLAEFLDAPPARRGFTVAFSTDPAIVGEC